jgi:hypothetical protein
MDPKTGHEDNFPFAEGLGSLNFTQIGTRIDLAYALVQWLNLPKP